MHEQAALAPPRRADDKLDILFVTSDLYPPFRPAAKAVFAEGLAARGHRIDWLMQAAAPTDGSGPQRFKGGTAYVAPTNAGASRMARLRRHLADIRNDLRVFGLLKRHRYSLVQIKDKYIGALFAIAAAKLHRVPVFYWLAYPHGEASLYAAESGVARYEVLYRLRGMLQRWLLYRVIMPSCTHVFVQSEQMRRDVASEGIPLESMTAVPSSLNLRDLDSAAPSTAPPAASPAKPTIVYLGTLLRERQLDFLVRAHALVVAEVPHAQLLFVGSGWMPDDEQLLQREAQRLGIERNVTITGWLPMPDAWQHVRQSALCVSPYLPVPILRSTSPTKLIEYMALGKPVVANDHPEQADVLQQSGAGLVCSWDEREFAKAIVELLKDPARCRKMGAAGRSFVAEHRTHWAMVELVAGRYRKHLTEPPKQPKPRMFARV
ncbi:MAG TPA: glycosyltransferase [Gammaproteobacteria bacterium]|nr:glycosyltransferase [Gammaproteobacteria bacterium]